MLITIIAFILILGLLVLVHEFGHFIVAKKSGVTVDEFGIGFPPRVFAKRYRETLYSINIIPLGGFVKIKGVPGDEEDSAKLKDKDAFAKQPFWRKSLILMSGVIMNLLLAIILFSIGFIVGLPSVIDDQVIASNAHIENEAIQVIAVAADTGASEQGVAPGDTIISIDGHTFQNVAEIQAYNADKIEQDVVVVFAHESETFTKNIRITESKDSGLGVLGVALVKVGEISYPWYKAIGLGFTTTFRMVGLIFASLGDLIARLFTGGGVSEDVAGPVGIAVLTGQVTRLGFIYILQFVALLSINLAIFNALPIPALDGGRFLFVLIEKLRGKTNNQNIEGTAHRLGFVLLILLVILVTFRDIGQHSESIKGFFQSIF